MRAIALLLLGVASTLPSSAFSADTSTPGIFSPVAGSGWAAAQDVVSARKGAPPLVAGQPYQDFEINLLVKCEGGCPGGLLISPVDHKNRPVLASFADNQRGAFYVPAGTDRTTAGEALPLNGGPFASLAPIPPRAGARTAVAVPAPPPPARGGRPAMPPPPPTPPSADGWHHLQIRLKAGTLGLRFDGQATAFAGYLLPEDFGPVQLALLSEAGRKVDYRVLSFTDLLRNVPVPAEQLGKGFRKLHLEDMFYTEAVAAGDVNHDGKPDLVAGPYAYLGPRFDTKVAIYPSRPVGPLAYHSSMLQFVADFTGDGWGDVLEMGLPGDVAILYVNPRGQSRYWEHHEVIPSVATESASLADVDGDGKPELVFGKSAGGRQLQIGYAKPDPANPTGPWVFHAISAPGPWATHGIGVGDVDGDGRIDVVNGSGWWSAPAAPGDAWVAHPANFGAGATIFVTDLDADGVSDVVSSLNGHGYGLAWFKGIRGPDGLRFEERRIMGNNTKPVGTVLFSELHAVGLADIDKDGLLDIVTGKRWWSHMDSELDPDPFGEPVLYWFKQTRVGGETRFEPHLINNRSGVGTQLVAEDLNGDGNVDIAVTNRRGTFLFEVADPIATQ